VFPVKKPWLALSYVALLALAGCPQQPAGTPSIDVYFSPRGGCTEAIVDEIGRARLTILVQAYSFTSAPIARALVEAHRRGVKVEAVLDSSQKSEKYSSADFLLHAGIPTRLDSKHAIAHNKVMVIDGGTVITGSFNFTKSAEQGNAENLLVIRDPGLAARYVANWQAHAEHSEPYSGKDSGGNGALEEDDEPAKAPSRRAAADPPAQTGTAAVGFLASTNSQVFHRAGCRAVSKISGKNLAVYGTREEALRDGRKPCSECKP
jgi:phosphatidylserine/phosphatidylglycerophosphate/cardiolipin synthase-like enzyme